MYIYLKACIRGAFRQSSVVVFISSELVMSAPTRVSVVTIGRYIHHGNGGGGEDKSRYSVLCASAVRYRGKMP